MPPAGRFANKVALVTASTAGIGLAIARRLGEEGASLVICSRRQASVDAALASLRFKGVRAVGTAAHVAVEPDVAALVKLAVDTYGGIDVLVSNAAVNPVSGGTLDTPSAAAAKIFDVNVTSLLGLTRAVLPHFRPGAAIVVISSVTAFAPAAPIAVYAASKTALIALARALAAELAPEVRVNCVAPGIVPTKFAAALVSDSASKEAIIDTTLLRRLGTSEDIAAAVAFLARTTLPGSRGRRWWWRVERPRPGCERERRREEGKVMQKH